MLTSLFLALAATAPVLAGEFIVHAELGDFYPYVVHLPDTATPAPDIPAHIFLHGMGSVGNITEIQTKTIWNGLGRRLGGWNEGNRTIANELAATRFFSIMPLMPNDTRQKEQDWNLDRVYAVLADAAERYPTQYNHSNVVISGYSSGARTLWDIFTNATAPKFTHAAVAAGEPSVDRLPNLGPNFDPNIRVQHYHGELDYEGSSNLAACLRTQNALGPRAINVALLNVSSTGHNDMADVPFNEQMMRFLLGEDNTAFTGVAPSTFPTSFPGVSASSTPAAAASASASGSDASASPSAGVFAAQGKSSASIVVPGFASLFVAGLCALLA